MTIENNKPALVRFKQKDGKISWVLFSQGAGGTNRHRSDIGFIKDKKIFYYHHYSLYNESNDYCRVKVYKWNFKEKFF